MRHGRRSKPEPTPLPSLPDFSAPGAVGRWLAQRRRNYPTQETIQKQQEAAEAVRAKELHVKGARQLSALCDYGSDSENDSDSQSHSEPATAPGPEASGNNHDSLQPSVAVSPATSLETPGTQGRIAVRFQRLSEPHNGSSDPESESDGDVDPIRDAVSSKAPPQLPPTVDTNADGAPETAAVPSRQSTGRRKASESPPRSTSQWSNKARKGRDHNNRRSLFDRLLAKDVRRDQIRVLQCLQYIVDHDFLGIPRESAQLVQKPLIREI
ncbi:hypothetical protein H4R33_006441 [Dimargaris cristalligena]|nr:hypothetical protein H4R33_006441 [Dimargaris cristalligena]